MKNNKSGKERMRKLRAKKHSDPAVFAYCAWYSINVRCVNSPYFKIRSSDRRTAYNARLNRQLQMARQEFDEWIKQKWPQIQFILLAGEKPSVDRIDPDRHYCIDNLQILSLKRNIARRRKRIPIDKQVCDETKWVEQSQKTLEKIACGNG